jgi:Domain of unknown function (DUF4440)
MISIFRSVLMAAAMAFLLSTAHAQQINDETGLEAVRNFISAVARGDPAELDTILAPEYQIVRANGVTIAKEKYLEGFPSSHTITGDYSVTKLTATGTGDIMVVSYFLEITEKIDGDDVAANAPRLTVFRYSDGAWRVSAHANFAAIAPPG